ncbi:hypothetical protein [Emticicia sp. 17c]|uniref:hypothetical protein n=1 Tax=Emticicia sp. 17c TaxID=3127704 RepID=UPI00301C28CA
MRKSVDQLLHETFDEEQNSPKSGWLEILSTDGGEEIRGGDRPYEPIIYESHTRRSRFKSLIFLEKLGL